MTEETDIRLFQNQEIRTKWDGRNRRLLLFSDRCLAILTESKNPSQYWRTLKSRINAEMGKVLQFVTG